MPGMWTTETDQRMPPYQNLFESRSYLVIDDFGDMRSMIKSILRALGVDDITLAGNGKNAVALMEKRTYDVVLCDFNLGSGRNGQQILEETRERKLLPDRSLFMMITAENTRDMVMSAIEYEPDGYLSKPFTKDVLRSRIEKLLDFKETCKPVYDSLDVGDIIAALRFIDHLLASKPRYPLNVKRLKAEALARARRYDEAEAEYERILAERELPWATMGLGKILFEQRKYNEAQEIFERLVGTNTTVPAAYDWLARCQRLAGKTELAMETLESGLKVSPNAILRQQGVAELAMIQGDYPRAEKAFGRASGLAQHSIYRDPSMLAGLVRAMTARKKYDAAMMTAKRITQEFRTDTRAQMYASVVCADTTAQMGKEDESLKHLENAAKLYERLDIEIPGPLALEYARSLSRTGDKERAEAVMKAVVQNHHDDQEFLSKAIETCRDAGISDDPEAMVQGLRKEIASMNNEGVRMIREGKLEPAIEFFRKAVKVMAGNTIINVNAALALIMNMEANGADSEQLRETRGYIDRVQKLDSGNQRLPSLVQRLRKLSKS